MVEPMQRLRVFGVGTLVVLAGCSLITSLDGLTGNRLDTASAAGSLDANPANDVGGPFGMPEAGDQQSGWDGDTQADTSIDDSQALGLVGSWRFDEGSGLVAIDSSGRNNNGVLVGGARRAPGRVGGALSLNGTDSYVRIPASPSLSTTDTMSVTLWMKLVAPGDSPRLIDRRDSWDIKINNGSPQLTNEGPHYAIAESTVGTGVWRHLAVTFDRGTTGVYIDGIRGAIATNTFTGDESLPIVSGELLIGTFDGKRNFTNGLIDEVRIYNRVLTPAEISAVASVGP